ncbi:NADH-quinone oxidoreductase subunit C [Streptomyces sp. NBC_00691]|uniref:NADH-quinone oxidoreductase subunit C n=1 Tax=Streptomyces sp. NBC_00691 TaxID=2903671 RepID=UPI002E2F94FE|nr:NADH-quinone oxidoreductase subunit C [Streptomyces sp. NBC_00691]
MTAYDSLPGSVTEVFGEEATAEQAYDLLTVDVPPGSWLTALETARDTLGCTYFDWLSAVDEPGTGFRVCAHVAAVGEGRPRRLLLRTTVPHAAPALPTAIGVYAGAGWHERETHEMFGVDFTGHPHLVPLLLPENFEGHPLRKDFVLAARVAKAWPGAKEPGESHEGGPKRRQMLPPGVPDPNEWGPLKGQLPPAPARPARAAAGDRPARRTRSVTEGSATQPETPTAPAADTTRPPRRSRSVSEGSASQAEPSAVEPETPTTPPADTTRPPRRSRSVSEGSASQAAASPEPSADTPPAAARPPRRTRSAADGSASRSTPDAPSAPSAPDGSAPRAEAAPPRTRSADAPWHHARPAFDEGPTPPPSPAEPAARTAPEPEDAPEPGDEPTAPEPEAAPEPETRAEPEPETPAAPEPDADAPLVAPAPGAPPKDGPTGPTGPEDPTGPSSPASPTGPTGPAEPTTPAGGDPA